MLSPALTNIFFLFSGEDIAEDVNEAIESEKAISDIKQEPYNLPDGFFWDTLDLQNPEVVSVASHFMYTHTALLICQGYNVKHILFVTRKNNIFSIILQLQDLYHLLNENYVEDDDNMFRLVLFINFI